MIKKSLTTQSLVNTYPKWTSVRTDEQSLGYQFLNTSSKYLDDLRKQELILFDNYFLPSANIADIDIYYKFQLPGTFVFEKSDNDETESLFVSPEVSGFVGSTAYSLSLVKNNNVEDFWYKSIPSRISLGETSSGAFLIASGYANQSPLLPLTISGIVDPANKLFITITSGEHFIGLNEDNTSFRTTVQVDGITKAGLSVVEEITFLENETIQTRYEYDNLNEVRIFGVKDLSTAFVHIKAATFNFEDHPIAWQGLSVDDENAEQSLFWSIGENELGQKVLDLSRHELNNIELRSQGFSNKFPLVRQGLYNTQGNQLIVPLDLCVEPKTDNIWIVDSGILYLYSADLPYTENNLLEKKNYDAASAIEPNSYYILLNETVNLDYIWKRPLQGIVRHRVFAEKPDKTKWNIENGILVPYNTGITSWFYGEPIGRSIRHPDNLTLDQKGSWIFTLEVQYSDGSSSKDIRIVSVLYQNAISQYNLLTLGIPNSIKGLSIDSSNQLWILTNSGVRYQILFHHDVMMIDYDRKVIYFREKYDQVRVF